MDVFVLNRAKAKKYSYQEHNLKSVIVSINDLEQNLINFNNNENNNILAVIKLRFDDVTSGYGVIKDDQAMKIANFIKYWVDKTDIIVVHCSAGVSRSAGCAAAIMKYINNDDTPIFKNPRYVPNMTVYRSVLTALMT
jgi:predicted protein tyrosine phosphatase